MKQSLLFFFSVFMFVWKENHLAVLAFQLLQRGLQFIWSWFFCREGDIGLNSFLPEDIWFNQHHLLKIRSFLSFVLLVSLSISGSYNCKLLILGLPLIHSIFLYPLPKSCPFPYSLSEHAYSAFSFPPLTSSVLPPWPSVRTSFPIPSIR